jgi:hypothetical protein
MKQIKDMTEQEQKQHILDKGMEGILNQKAFAYDKETEKCSYYDEEGNKCIIGHLCTNEEAKNSQSFLSSGFDVLYNLGYLENVCNFGLLLQEQHDNIVIDMLNLVWNKKVFIEEMRAFANKHSLDFKYT